jgi:hypothetical protein
MAPGKDAGDGKKRCKGVPPSSKLQASCRDGRRCPSPVRRVVGANERVRYGKRSTAVPLPERPAAGEGDSSRLSSLLWPTPPTGWAVGCWYRVAWAAEAEAEAVEAVRVVEAALAGHTSSMPLLAAWTWALAYASAGAYSGLACIRCIFLPIAMPCAGRHMDVDFS